MAEDRQLYNSVATLSNVVALVELITRVQNRDHGLPGMAVFYGPSGYGKSSACTYAANKFRAHVIQIKSCWTTKKFCEAILFDLGLKPARTIGDMVDQIAEDLARSGRPLLIDEADHLVDRRLIEIVRDIYESSGAPVILVGEERLPGKLQQWERIHNRMLDWVAAEPGTLDDVVRLAEIYCRGVELDAALQAQILEMSANSLRRISVNLARVREFGRSRGMKRVTQADWGKTGFFTGAAPSPRRISA